MVETTVCYFLKFFTSKSKRSKNENRLLTIWKSEATKPKHLCMVREFKSPALLQSSTFAAWIRTPTGKATNRKCCTQTEHQFYCMRNLTTYNVYMCVRQPNTLDFDSNRKKNEKNVVFFRFDWRCAVLEWKLHAELSIQQSKYILTYIKQFIFHRNTYHDSITHFVVRTIINLCIRLLNFEF